MRRGTTWALGIGKLGISAALLAYVLRGMDDGLLEVMSGALRLPAVILVLGLFVAIFALNAVRWQRLTEQAGWRVSFADALSLTWIGHFFNQLLPTSLGGDAVRAWYARNASTDLTRAAATVLCDRAIGVWTAGLLIAVLLPAIWQPSASTDWLVVLAIAGGCLLMHAVFIAARPLFARHPALRLLELCARLLLDALRHRRAAGWVFGSSTLAHICLAGVGYVLVASLRPAVPAFECAALFLTALLVATLPVSYAGWGLREASMVYFLGAAGVDAEAAFAASVSFGVLLAAASAPGALCWATRRGRVGAER